MAHKLLQSMILRKYFKSLSSEFLGSKAQELRALACLSPLESASPPRRVTHRARDIASLMVR